MPWAQAEVICIALFSCDEITLDFSMDDIVLSLNEQRRADTIMFSGSVMPVGNLMMVRRHEEGTGITGCIAQQPWKRVPSEWTSPRNYVTDARNLW